MEDIIESMILDNKNLLPEFLEALYGMDGIQAEIIPIGIFNRPFKDEIERYDYIDSLSKRIYYSNRTAVYDGLPKRIFHQSKNTSQVGEISEAAKDLFKRTRQEESNARDFFNPVDRLLQDLRIEISRYTYSNISAGNDNFLCTLFDVLWDEYAQTLTPYQKIIYMMMIAHRQQVLGDMSSISAYLTMFTGEKASIVEKIKSVRLDTPPKYIKYRLGVDFSLGTGFEEVNNTYQINLGPVEVNKTELFLPGKNMDLAIRFLLSSVMPLESIYSYQITVQQPSSFNLSASRLGYTTTIT